jgi:mycoredoxin
MRYVVIVLLLGGVFVWQHRADIGNWIDPPDPIVLPAGTQVVLYATAWCGYCAKARAMLSARSVPYVEYDIEKSDLGYDQYQRLNGKGVPVLLIGDQVIHGFDKGAITSALEKL